MKTLALALLLAMTLSAHAEFPPRLLLELTDEAAAAARANSFALPDAIDDLGLKDAELRAVFYEPNDEARHALWLKHGLNRWFRLLADGLDAEQASRALKSGAEILQTHVSYPVTALITPNDYSVHDMWGLTQMQCPEAWDVHHAESPIIVTTIDTGCEIAHVDLAQNIHVHPGEDLNHNGVWDPSDNNGVDDDDNGFIDDLSGWDFVSHGVNPDDSAHGEDYAPRDNEVWPDVNGHGTHVMGSAAGVTDNSIGVACASWNVRALPLRAGFAWVTPEGWLQGSGYTDDFSAAIQYAADNGARVISISFGGTAPDPGEQQIINYAWDLGVITVAAAGNENSSQRIFPGAFNNVIAVAATQRGDVRAGFSTYGNWVDVAAPGVGIWSTMSNNEYHQRNYDSWSGTSMATPNVAGVLGLMLSADPDLSAADAERILVQTADNFETINPDFLGELGSGRVNAFACAGIAAGNHLPPPRTSGVVVDDLAGTIFFGWMLEDSGRGDFVRYRVYRDNELIDSTVSDVYEGPLGAPGFHRFGVSAVYAAGASVIVSAVVNYTPALSLPISDDFESGLAQWQIEGLTQTVNSPVYQGQNSLMCHSGAGDVASAQVNFDAVTTMEAETWFRFAMNPGADGFQSNFAFVDVSNNLVSVGINAEGTVTLFTSEELVTPSLQAVLPPTQWLKYNLRVSGDLLVAAVLNGSSQVLFNFAVPLPDLNDYTSAILAGYFAGSPCFYDRVRMREVSSATFYQPVNPTVIPYAVVISSATGCTGALNPPAEIGIFDGQTCVGSGRVNGDWPMMIQTFGDLGEGGFTSGNPILFRIWSPVCGDDPAAANFEIGDGTFGNGAYARASIATSVAADHTPELQPAEFALYPAFPNPFNAQAELSFSLPSETRAALTLFNSLGREVRVIRDDVFSAGEHRVNFTAQDLPSGVYFVRLTAANHTAQQKLLLLK